MNKVYINKTSRFLPNKPIANDQMENFLGNIGGNASRVKNIILKKNQIKQRYYGLNEEGKITHTNSEMTAEAIRKLYSEDFKPWELEFLTCGTSIADQLMPSHASMVHGLLKETKNLEIMSPSGVCASAMQGLNSCFNALKSGSINYAISSGSELVSPILRTEFFEVAYEKLAQISDKPAIAFEKDFLRFMLSDGAGAFLLTNKLSSGLNYEINWITGHSFANEMLPCMTAGCEVTPEKELLSWKGMSPEKWAQESVFAIQQDVQLVENCVPLGVKALSLSREKSPFNPEEISYLVPHISSMYFQDKLYNELQKNHLNINKEKWYISLSQIGNIGSASIYATLDMLPEDNDLKEGDKILLLIPESSRFNFYNVMLTVRIN